MKEGHLGGTDQAYFTVKGTIIAIKRDFERPPWYETCTAENCSKKVTISSVNTPPPFLFLQPPILGLFSIQNMFNFVVVSLFLMMILLLTCRVVVTHTHTHTHTQQDGSMWQCPCGHSSETFAPSYILPLVANDHTGSSWMAAFNEAATQILNCEAIHLQGLKVTPPTKKKALRSRCCACVLP